MIVAAWRAGLTPADGAGRGSCGAEVEGAAGWCDRPECLAHTSSCLLFLQLMPGTAYLRVAAADRELVRYAQGGLLTRILRQVRCAANCADLDCFARDGD
jgi:hypothetical protein